MSTSLSAYLCLLLLTAVLAAPTENFGEKEPSRVRLPRATCDLLSFEVGGTSVNHAACALHCLSMRRGYTGGFCQNGICHCR